LWVFSRKQPPKITKQPLCPGDHPSPPRPPRFFFLPHFFGTSIVEISEGCSVFFFLFRFPLGDFFFFSPPLTGVVRGGNMGRESPRPPGKFPLRQGVCPRHLLFFPFCIFPHGPPPGGFCFLPFLFFPPLGRPDIPLPPVGCLSPPPEPSPFPAGPPPPKKKKNVFFFSPLLFPPRPSAGRPFTPGLVVTPRTPVKFFLPKTQRPHPSVPPAPLPEQIRGGAGPTPAKRPPFVKDGPPAPPHKENPKNPPSLNHLRPKGPRPPNHTDSNWSFGISSSGLRRLK